MLFLENPHCGTGWEDHQTSNCKYMSSLVVYALLVKLLAVLPSEVYAVKKCLYFIEVILLLNK